MVFYYCEDSINRNRKNHYVPVLGRNTSSLESLFSNIRGMCGHNETSVTNYTAAISKIRMRSNSLMLKFNKTYLEEDAEIEQFKPVFELPKPSVCVYKKYNQLTQHMG
jgi:hypothetical protein